MTEHTTFYRHYTDAMSYDWRFASPFFTPKELASKDTGELLVHWPSLVLLNKLRLAWQRPIHLNSAYRSVAHNLEIGGEKNSQHLLGRAFDCRITDDSFRAMAIELGFTGIGLYDTFTHIDTRATNARWDNRTKNNLT